MSAEFAMDVLERCEFATLAMTLPDGSPYCIPISPACVDGAIYFHCAQQGQKMLALSANPSVCLSAVCDVKPIPEEFATEYSSAIVFGEATEVADEAEKIAALRAICERYASTNMEAFGDEIDRCFHRTAIWRISIREITGKHK